MKSRETETFSGPDILGLTGSDTLLGRDPILREEQLLQLSGEVQDLIRSAHHSIMRI